MLFVLSAAVVIMLAVILTGCVGSSEPQTFEALPPFENYRSIPGLTDDEIEEIEKVLAEHNSFSYAMMLSTEAFVDAAGNINGFSKEFTEYLTTIFDVPFVPQIVTLEELFEGLENGSLDFTGTLTPTQERRQIYHMTDPIAQRAIKYYRLFESRPVDEIMQERAPRLAMLGRAASTQTILDFAFYDFEPVFIDEYADAYALMKSGEIDALLAEGSVETTFDATGDIISESFFPMINAFVSFTAYRDELAPIVNAVQKMLENGAAYYIGGLYDTGRDEYLKHKLSLQLTSDEKQYINDNPVILFGAEFDNYPISFYDERSGQWQGVAIDVLAQICRLTGLSYEVINGNDTAFKDIIDMLDSGSIHMISELILSDEREGGYLWPRKPFITDNSVLMSRTGYHNVHLDRVYSERVGLVRDTAHTEFFNTWFPAHPHIIMYDDYNAALDDLKNGGVDLVMASYCMSIYMSNYLEETIYRPAIVFDNSFESTFGIGKGRETLLSITEKAMELIDIQSIADTWLHKTYDYRLRLAEENNDLFRNMILVMLCILLLVGALLIRNYHMSKRLEELVASRTKELAHSVEEISKARDEAEVANKSKSYFLANMSHEIRTPMNAISGITEIILLSDDLPEDVKDGLIRINNSCDLLMGIINDILDFSKIEAGKLDIVNKEYYVASVINDSAQLNKMRIGDKNIKFLLDIDENTPAKLLGDELRIKQIMNNLLSNAFKYTEKGEVRLSVHTVETDDELVLVISVKDTGCGMTESQLGKLFEAYTRFYQQVNVSVEGTGLGLVITRRLVSLMGGDIKVDSKANEGSVFTVTLPQGKVDDEVLGKENTENLKELRMGIGRSGKGSSIIRDPMPYGRVLCVDDVETNLYVAIGLLKPYRLEIDTAMSGQEAIDMIESGGSYDIVFMDHMMPDMDGVKTTAILRQLGYKQPIVALTANAVAGQSDMFLNNGFDDFIAKPIDIRQLNTVLNRLIRDKQPKDVIEKARNDETERKRKQSEKPSKTMNTGKKPLIGSTDTENNDIDIILDDFTDDLVDMPGIASMEIDGIDIIKGLEKYSYDEDIYIKILKSYAANTRIILETIEAMGTVNEDNLADYRLKVHSMKGTSLDMYADEVGNTAAKLEKEAKEGNTDYVNEHTGAFLKMATKIIDDLDILLSEIDAANPKPSKEYPDKELLLQLKDACEMYSMDGVNNAMDEIEKYIYTADDGLVLWLREKVNVMGFKQIIEKLSDL